MLKFLFFVALFILLVRYINRLFLPSGNSQNRFNAFQGGSQRRRRNIDDIEEAEYEDLSQKDK